MARSYEQKLENFSWSIAEQALGYRAGDAINIGWHCSDRICRQGKASKTALIWEGLGGAVKRYTYDDVRLASNAVGAFLR
ncbi:MAG TPA: hypothetical protein VIL47_03500, partial [Candidatus Bipolaricaulota bacterium]